MTTPATYETFVLHQILPVQGWQAIYVTDGGAHMLVPLYFLALVTRRHRRCGTGDLRPDWHPQGLDVEDEGREVVGLDYDPEMSSFAPCDELDNYCGLLPPDLSLAAYLEGHHCGVRRRTEEVR